MIERGRAWLACRERFSAPAACPQAYYVLADLVEEPVVDWVVGSETRACGLCDRSSDRSIS